MNDRDRLYQEILDAWNSDEFAYALEMSREFVSSFPDYGLGWMMQGIMLREIGRYAEAEQVIHNAVVSLPSGLLYAAYTDLGHLYKDWGDYEQAERWYRKAVDLKPDNAGPYVFLGNLQARKGDFHGAEMTHRRGTQCSTGYIDEAFYNLGHDLRAQERYEEALVCFGKAVELDPDYSIALAAKRDVEKTLKYLSRIEAQQAAAPNGGPAVPVDKSDAPSEPPSVS